MLGLEPSIRYDLDEVLRRKRVEERHHKGEVMILANLIFF